MSACLRCGGHVDYSSCPCQFSPAPMEARRASCGACGGALMYPGQMCACGGPAQSRVDTYPAHWGKPLFSPGSSLHTEWIASNIAADLGRKPRNPAQRPLGATGLSPADAGRILDRKRSAPGDPMSWDTAIGILRRKYLGP